MPRVIVLLALITACARSNPNLRLDGALVLGQPDGILQAGGYDPDTLFAEAGRAFDAQDYKRAVHGYRLLLRYFPASDLTVASRFNLALAYENLDQVVSACSEYEHLASIERLPDDLWRRIYLGWGACSRHLSQWDSALHAYNALIASENLSDIDAVEAWMGRGEALLYQRSLEDAEISLTQALSLHRRRIDKGEYSDPTLAGRAALLMGHVAMAQFANEKLMFPNDVLQSTLMRKCEKLLSAQHRYLRAIRYGGITYAGEAALRIGTMYEELHQQIRDLEIPPDLTIEQKDIYREEVRGRIHVLIQKASLVYEKTLGYGRRYGMDPTWMERLDQAIQRLERTIDGPTLASAPP